MLKLKRVATDGLSSGLSPTALDRDQRRLPVSGHALIQTLWAALMLVLCAKQIIHLFTPGSSLWIVASIVGLTFGWALLAITLWFGDMLLLSPHGFRGPKGS